MGFKLKINQLTQLFNPDSIHRGLSLQRLKKLGKIKALQTLLKTNFHKGLLNDPTQNAKRRAFYGNNSSCVKKPDTIWQIIFKNFNDELIRLMIAAGFVSLILGILSDGWKWGWIEGFSIFFAVAIVIFLSTVNNYVHQKSFAQLKGQQTINLVKAYRGGRLYLIDPQEIMVGDVVEIMGGERISFDGILISGEDLLVDESQITGEAVQVKKRVPISYDRHQGADPFLLSSSKITSGVGIMVVLAVGQHSYYGHLTAKINQQHLDSPLRQKLANLSDQINQISIVFAIITFSSLIIHDIYWIFQEEDPMDFLFSGQALSQLVSAILVTFTIDVALPQTLPLLITIALSRTARQLEKNSIFIKKLNQCETMGSIDSFCVTKTGFISKNLLSVSQIYVQQRLTCVISRQAMSQSTCRLLCLAIVLNTQATPKFIEDKQNRLNIEHIGNKTESALLQMAYRMGYNYERFRLHSKVKRIYSTTVPRKKMASIYKDEKGKLFLFVKGSPKFMLSYCRYYINQQQKIVNTDFTSIDGINNAIQHFTKTNQKIIIVAYQQINFIPTKWSQVDKNLVLLAIIGIKDFIRDHVKQTVKQFQKLGINVRILSSQNRNDAIGAAKESGILPHNWVQKKGNDYTVLEGSQFRDLVCGLAKQDKTNLQRKLAFENFKMIKENLKVIYRASAEDKLLLAIGLKQCGHIVAVAGNGTNDTEALRKADVSISMGSCNQTAKQASDIVLLDDNFKSILHLIYWGRHTFEMIRKFLTFQLTINLVAAIMALLGAIFLGESPLHPLQMLWINIIIDFLGSLSLILEKPLQNKMIKISNNRKQKIFSIDMLKLIVSQALIEVIILSIILFEGPQILGVIDSIGVSEWNIQTGKHQSIFFNTFIMLQIFNQYNARFLNFSKLNVFSGLLFHPNFLCFSLMSFILQFTAIKYVGKILHLTQLSFKENLLCFVLGSLSISGSYLFKIITPQHFKLSKNGIQIGKFKYYWNKQLEKQMSKRQEKDLMNYIPLPEAQLEILSPRFGSFIKKRRVRQMHSYIEQKQTMSFEIDELGFTEDQIKY